MRKKILIGIGLILMLGIFLALSPSSREVINAQWIFQQGLKITGGKFEVKVPVVSGVSPMNWATFSSSTYAGGSGYQIRDINQSLLYTYDVDSRTTAYHSQTTAGTATVGVTAMVVVDVNKDHNKIFGIQNISRTGVTPLILEFVADESGNSPFFIDSTSAVTNQASDAYGDIQWFRIYCPPENNKHKTGNSVFYVSRYIH